MTLLPNSFGSITHLGGHPARVPVAPRSGKDVWYNKGVAPRYDIISVVINVCFYPVDAGRLEALGSEALGSLPNAFMSSSHLTSLPPNVIFMTAGSIQIRF
ncbi:MAG: hypothetical protein LBQ66_01800 [Planctomycetaceae bacterium]|nr:hypothetical protein [Planctomycetaceae bacterium]